MSLPNDLTKETKSIVASNLTTALAVLVASGKKEDEVKPIIISWLNLFFDQLSAPKEKDYMFDELRNK